RKVLDRAFGFDRGKRRAQISTPDVDFAEAISRGQTPRAGVRRQRTRIARDALGGGNRQRPRGSDNRHYLRARSQTRRADSGRGAHLLRELHAQGRVQAAAGSRQRGNCEVPQRARRRPALHRRLRASQDYRDGARLDHRVRAAQRAVPGIPGALGLRFPGALTDEAAEQQAHRFDRLYPDHREVAQDKRRETERGKLVGLALVPGDARRHRAAVERRAKLRSIDAGALCNRVEHPAIRDVSALLECRAKDPVVIRRKNARVTRDFRSLQRGYRIEPARRWRDANARLRRDEQYFLPLALAQHAAGLEAKIARRDRHALPERLEAEFLLELGDDSPCDVAKRRGVIEVDWNPNPAHIFAMPSVRADCDNLPFKPRPQLARAARAALARLTRRAHS